MFPAGDSGSSKGLVQRTEAPSQHYPSQAGRLKAPQSPHQQTIGTSLAIARCNSIQCSHEYLLSLYSFICSGVRTEPTHKADGLFGALEWLGL